MKTHKLSLLLSFNLKGPASIFTFIALVLALNGLSQPAPFYQDGKWGMKENETEFIAPVYDTIFPFDSTGKICLACFKTKTSSANKFIKVMVTTYSCNYLNRNKVRLFIKLNNKDTCSVFSLPKTKDKQYLNNSPLFIASVKNRKYIVTKDFVQQTFKNYQEISFSEDPYFYVVQNLNEVENLMTGLINQKEELIVPCKFSGITLNPQDSLIVACAAGVSNTSEDEVFNYEGKRIHINRRHIELATKNFLIHKIYEKKEYYLSYNINTKEEFKFFADEVAYDSSNQILLKIKNEWFVYDLLTNKKIKK